MNDSPRIHHLVSPEDWNRCFDGNAYRPDSLANEGYVHLSAPDQLAASRSRHFPGTDALLVVDVDPSSLPDLVWEDKHGHGIFPHHRGPIPADAIRGVRGWSDDVAR